MKLGIVDIGVDECGGVEDGFNDDAVGELEYDLAGEVVG